MNNIELPIKQIIEAALMAADKPLDIPELIALFDEPNIPESRQLREVIAALQEDCAERGVELRQVASGYRYQSKQEYAPWLKKMWEEKAPRYSRAFIETLVLIAYRQPITRAEIEEIRGVAVNAQIIKTLIEREWVKVVGHRDVPGKPELLGTTKLFLDYFNLQSLNDLPTLEEIQDLDNQVHQLEKQLQLDVFAAAEENSANQAALLAAPAADIIKDEIIETEHFAELVEEATQTMLEAETILHSQIEAEMAKHEVKD
jgi:segregation and condensation protein B